MLNKAMIKDGLNWMSRINYKRAKNMTKVLSSYYLSRLSSKPIHTGLPFSISLEPTTACNLRCPECPSGLRMFSRPKGLLEKEVFEKIVAELKDSIFYLILYFQGEPYLHKSLFEFIRYAEDHNIYTATSTNGHFLNDRFAQKTVESGLSRLIISIDGVTQEVYEAYRREGKLEKVLQGAANVVKWKKKLKSKTPHIIFQFLVVKPNEHQIPEIKRIAKEIGVDEVKLKSAQVYDYEHGNPLIPDNEKYARYKKQKDGTYTIKNKLLNHCWKMWHSCVFTWDGQVVPCCFDKDATHKFGSIQDHHFADIWQNESYQNFRSALLRGRKEIDICKNCTEGCKVWV